MSRSQRRARSTGLLLAALVFASCGPASIKSAQLDATALSDGDFAEIWGSWGRLSKAAFNAVVKSDFEQTEKVREIPNRARKELEAL